jgi:phosphoribosylaminoimidazolecarboxamide formyltransferase/IMP cyclohydrolase
MIQSKPLPPPADRYPVRRALLSVSDKTGLAAFARRLHALGVELLSTGGTARALREAGLPVKDVAEVTGSPELLDGRVKTLHPKVHAGILARRTDPDDLAQLEAHGIGLIDLVVVNLYPFAEATAKAGVTDAEAAENVDIGGPTMVRAAAKNWFFVGVVTSPDHYDRVARELEANDGTLGMAKRRELAIAAFAHTAAYDHAIFDHLYRTARLPQFQIAAIKPWHPTEGEPFDLRLPHAQPLRYGENPHQRAALYGYPERFYRQLHGKELSFNNLLDLSAALRLIAEFEDAAPTVAILKHTNPCGVGTADTLAEAYARAFATDRQSPFGGIVVVNRPLDRAAAEAVDAVFTELVIAPAFEEGVLDFLRQKANRRLIEVLRSSREDDAPDVRSVVGGLLVQDPDPALEPPEALRAGWQVATERAPTEQEWADLDFAWRVCKHVKSNAIVYARGGATLGVGAGQMSRIDSSEIAVSKGRKSGLDFAGCVVASDAFFPFPDGLIAAAEAGARAVVQPGGSVRDDEVIAAANARGLAMVFTGRRHFRH